MFNFFDDISLTALASTYRYSLQAIEYPYLIIVSYMQLPEIGAKLN